MLQPSTIEFGGEIYEERPPYDPYMIQNIWGCALGDQNDIIAVNRSMEDIDHLLAHGLLPSSGKILVGGSRYGGHLFALRKRGLQAFGIEQNADMVAYLKDKFSVDFVSAGNLSKLPFDDNTFNACLYHSSLFMNEEDTENFQQLSEMKRVLVPSGTVITEGANGQYWESIRRSVDELHEFSSVDEALDELKKAPAMAKPRRKDDLVWSKFYFMVAGTEGPRVNHTYHFIPKQQDQQSNHYYHEIVNYDPYERRVGWFNQYGFHNMSGTQISVADVYADYTLTTPFSERSKSGVIVAVNP